MTLDTTLVGAGNVNGANSVTLSGFSTGGTNRLLLLESDCSQDGSTVSGYTGGTGLSFSLVARINKGTSQGNVELWAAWLALQQASTALTLNFTGTNFPQAAVRTECWSGGADGSVAISNCFGGIFSAAFGSGTNPTGSVTTTRSGSQVVAAIGQDGVAAVTPGANQTNEGTTSSVGSFSSISALYQNANTPLGGTAVTMNATLGLSTASGIIIVELLSPPNSNAPGNQGKYFRVGDGMSRSEVAN